MQGIECGFKEADRETHVNISESKTRILLSTDNLSSWTHVKDLKRHKRRK